MKKNAKNLYPSDGNGPQIPSTPKCTNLDLENTEPELGEPNLEPDLEKLDLEDLEKELEQLKHQMTERQEKLRSFRCHLRELQEEYNYCWSRLVQPLQAQEAHHVPLRVRLETAGALLTKSMERQLKEMKVEAVVPEEITEVKECEPLKGRLVKSLSTSNLNMPQ
jgi:hypothetical protein